jgi:hypothetical protein
MIKDVIMRNMMLNLITSRTAYEPSKFLLKSL